MSHLLFTLDFHEMVRGQLKKDDDCRINYDPQRLAAGKEGYIHGSADFDFTAHLEFKPAGAAEVKLTSETGITTEAIIRNDGRGSMLTGKFRIPANAEEIIVWIVLKDNNGIVTYDNNEGNNYHFRISQEDTQITSAIVTNSPTEGLSKFNLKVSTIPLVREVTIRYRLTNSKDPLREIPVTLKASSQQDHTEWDTGAIEIPYGSVVAYDLIYFIGNNRFKLDNNGNYYIADVK